MLMTLLWKMCLENAHIFASKRQVEERRKTEKNAWKFASKEIREEGNNVVLRTEMVIQDHF